MADATVQSTQARVADVLARPQDPAAIVQETGTEGERRPPDRARNALARRPNGGRIRLPVIEHDVPGVPDRQAASRHLHPADDRG